MSSNANHHTAGLCAGFAIAALAAAFGHTAHAQGQYIPLSRAEVNAQTRAASHAGLLVAGEADPAVKQPAPVSSRSRTELKDEVVAANRDGGLSSGKRSYYTHNIAPREQLAKSTKTRADGKADTLQAIHDHKVIGAGEAGS